MRVARTAITAIARGKPLTLSPSPNQRTSGRKAIEMISCPEISDELKIFGFDCIFDRFIGPSVDISDFPLEKKGSFSITLFLPSKCTYLLEIVYLKEANINLCFKLGNQILVGVYKDVFLLVKLALRLAGNQEGNECTAKSKASLLRLTSMANFYGSLL